MNILIVDDEPIAQDIMESYVQKLPQLNLVGKSKNALEAFSILSKQQVDLMLLDINMPEITGIDLLHTLKDPPMVVFTTAYAEYALESYELNAIDYLVKPVPFERFLKAIQKAQKHIARKAVQQAAPAKVADDFIFVKADGKLVRIELAKLMFAEGLKDYVRLWTAGSKIVVHSTMKNIEDQLVPYGNFIRIHKSYIINLNYISEIDGNSVRLADQLLTIGNTYRDSVMDIFDRYKLL